MNMLLPRHVKMARAGLEISRRELAEEAKLSRNTIARFESSEGEPNPGTVELLANALTRLGVTWYGDDDDCSVRVRKRV